MFFDFDVDNRNDLSHILLNDQSVHDYVFKTVSEINNILDRVIQVPSAVEMRVWLIKSDMSTSDNENMDWDELILGGRSDVNGFLNVAYRLTLEQVHDKLIETFNEYKSVYTFRHLFDAMLMDLTQKVQEIRQVFKYG